LRDYFRISWGYRSQAPRTRSPDEQSQGESVGSDRLLMFDNKQRTAATADLDNPTIAFGVECSAACPP
jgi:hypothetical protein